MRYLFCKCGLRIYFRLFSGITKLNTKSISRKTEKEQDEFISQTKENTPSFPMIFVRLIVEASFELVKVLLYTVNHLEKVNF